MRWMVLFGCAVLLPFRLLAASEISPAEQALTRAIAWADADAAGIIAALSRLPLEEDPRERRSADLLLEDEAAEVELQIQQLRSGFAGQPRDAAEERRWRLVTALLKLRLEKAIAASREEPFLKSLQETRDAEPAPAHDSNKAAGGLTGTREE